MLFNDLLEYCKIKAIGDALQPDADAIYREFCRSYSETFHTPLREVFDLDPEFVLLHVFEHQLKDYDVEKNVDHLLETIGRIDNPNFDADEEEALQEYIKKLQAEEDAKKDRKKASENKEPESPIEAIPEGMPTRGSMDFSALGDKEG